MLHLTPVSSPETATTTEEEAMGRECVMSVLKTKKGEGVGVGLGLGLGCMIQPSTPYVHPLMRRSSFLMSQKSLEMCTESLGSETGSDDFSAEDERVFSASSEEEEVGNGRKELCSMNLGSHYPRWFPPLLPSISSRDGPCLVLRPHRRDGRLVMEAVPVSSHNHLYARRHNGRLLLAFVDSSWSKERRNKSTPLPPPLRTPTKTSPFPYGTRRKTPSNVPACQSSPLPIPA